MPQEHGHKGAGEPKVFVENNNIYFVDERGRRIQLTSSGKDGDAILSPNKKQIIFVRQAEKSKDSSYEIWVVDKNEKKPKILIKNKHKSRGQGENAGWLLNLSFSPDGKKIYYVCRSASPTINAVRSVNSDGTGDKWIHWGESVTGIGGAPTDKYYGYLLVKRRAEDKIYENVYAVMTPEGKEVELIGALDKWFWEKHQKVE